MGLRNKCAKGIACNTICHFFPKSQVYRLNYNNQIKPPNKNRKISETRRELIFGYSELIWANYDLNFGTMFGTKFDIGGANFMDIIFYDTFSSIVITIT